MLKCPIALMKKHYAVLLDIYAGYATEIIIGN